MWRKGLARVGRRRRAHPPPARGRRVRHLHAGQQRGTSGLDAAFVRARPARSGAGRPARRCASGSAVTASSLLSLRGIEADPVQSREHILLSTILDKAWRDGKDLDLAAIIQQIQGRRFTKVGRARSGVLLSRQGALRAGDADQQPAGLAGLRGLDGGRGAGYRADAAHPGRQAARGDLLDRAPERCRADVLRFAAAQPGAGLGAHAARHDQPAGAVVHGRDLRLLPARRQSAIETAAAHAAEAGAGVRAGSGAGNAESRGSGLQGPGQHRHLVHRTAADRARQDAAAGRTGGRAAEHGGEVRPGQDGSDPGGARQPRVPDEQRPRGRTGGIREPVDPVVSAGTADEGGDPETGTVRA